MFTLKNWARFQHYTQRHPPWIKLYHDLLDDGEFAALDHFAQLLYFKLLMAASRKDNQIPEDAAWMATELSLPRRRVQTALGTLLDAGFLASENASNRASNGASALASKSASPSRAPAHSRESEPESEIEPSVLPAEVNDQPKGRTAGRPNEIEAQRLEPAAILAAAHADDDIPL